MPLNWNAEKVENIKELQESPYWQVTAEFCFVLGAIGVTKVTEENWQEVAKRCYLFEKINGAFFSFWNEEEGSKPYPITPEFVKRHIGYTTNNSNRTNSQFLKQIWGNVTEDVEAIIRSNEKNN